MSYETLKKLLFKFDPETAHSLAEFGLRGASFVADAALQRVFCPRELKADLSQELFGKSYANPIGIAGGFDKNATMIRPLASLGFGFVEFGTFTPKPQSGNAKPRLFRLVQERSLQNAMGFNNEGMEAVQRNVAPLYPFRAPIWANVGKTNSLQTIGRLKITKFWSSGLAKSVTRLCLTSPRQIRQICARCKRRVL